MLEFGKFNEKWDIKVAGLGHKFLVSEVQTTTLKEPRVGKNIPTVAEVSQGEVIKFASEAVTAMGEDGVTVLLEGREATVDHIPSPHRFALTISDSTVIGARRAAQRICGMAAKALEVEGCRQDVNTVEECVRNALAEVTKDR